MPSPKPHRNLAAASLTLLNCRSGFLSGWMGRAVTQSLPPCPDHVNCRWLDQSSSPDLSYTLFGNWHPHWVLPNLQNIFHIPLESIFTLLCVPGSWPMWNAFMFSFIFCFFGYNWPTESIQTRWRRESKITIVIPTVPLFQGQQLPVQAVLSFVVYLIPWSTHL